MSICVATSWICERSAAWLYAWFDTNAASYNFRNYKTEAWHWQYIT